jgi:hypothetical protein
VRRRADPFPGPAHKAEHATPGRLTPAGRATAVLSHRAEVTRSAHTAPPVLHEHAGAAAPGWREPARQCQAGGRRLTRGPVPLVALPHRPGYSVSYPELAGLAVAAGDSAWSWTGDRRVRRRPPAECHRPADRPQARSPAQRAGPGDTRPARPEPANLHAGNRTVNVTTAGKYSVFGAP